MSAERDRWIQHLAKLAQVHGHADGQVDQGESEQHSVARRRSTCRNSQIKSTFGTEIPRLAQSLLTHGVNFPVHWRQLTEYLQVRYSEPCVRGSLKLVHSSYIFLQEVAGVGGQAHGLLDVCCCIEGTYVTGDSWKASPPGSTVPGLFYSRRLRTWY